MIKLVSSAVVAVALMTLPAFAQTSTPNSSAPGATNSGAGVPGHPGNKNGPPAKAPGTTGAGSSMSGPNASGNAGALDAAGVKGQPGNKSGPPAKAPGSSSGK